MVFDLRDVLDQEAYPPFEVVTENGGTVTLPNINTLTLRQAERLHKGDLGVLREVAPEAAELLMDLPAYAVNKLLTAWLEHGQNGDRLGNPRPSSPSGRSTARTSKRT